MQSASDTDCTHSAQVQAMSGGKANEEQEQVSDPLSEKMGALSVENALSDGGAMFAFGPQKQVCYITQKALSKIPVLGAMVRTELHKERTADGAIVYNSADLMHMAPIIAFAETGQSFYLLAKLSASGDITRVFQLMDELCVETPIIDPEEILKGLRQTQGAHREKIARRCYEEVSSERYLGRQSAGLFALALYRDSFGISSLKMKQKVFQGVQFVVSHPATFYFRTRTHIKALYNLKIQGSVTVKEDGLITSWMQKFSERHFDSDGSSPDDKFMTSEDESTGYDSNDS